MSMITISLKSREFALTIKRPFVVRYNPYNQSIEILSNTQQVSNIVSDLKGEICIIFNALKKMEKEKPAATENGCIEEKQTTDPIDELESKDLAKKQKLIRNYKRLEEAFRNLSIDFAE